MLLCIRLLHPALSWGEKELGEIPKSENYCADLNGHHSVGRERLFEACKSSTVSWCEQDHRSAWAVVVFRVDARGWRDCQSYAHAQETAGELLFQP